MTEFQFPLLPLPLSPDLHHLKSSEFFRRMCVASPCLPGPQGLESWMRLCMRLRLQRSNVPEWDLEGRTGEAWAFFLPTWLGACGFSAAAIAEALVSCPCSPGLWQTGCRARTWLVALLLYLHYTYHFLFQWVRSGELPLLPDVFFVWRRREESAFCSIQAYNMECCVCVHARAWYICFWLFFFF